MSHAAALLLTVCAISGCPGSGTVAFEFIAPEGDVQLRPGETETVAWEGQSLWPDGFVTIEVYRQLTGSYERHDIAEAPFPDEWTVDSLAWDGRDMAGEPLQTGLYNLTATVTRNGVINYSFLAGEGKQIALQGLHFVEPPGPVTFTGSLVIEFHTMSFDNLTVDLLLDPEEGAGGDPRSIALGLDVLAEAAIQSTTWSWDGTDADGVAVPAGDYLLGAHIADDAGVFAESWAEGVVITVP